MAIGSCRGDTNKQRIVSDYKLIPLAHVKLLNGQQLSGCCGPVQDRYYHFEATLKAGGPSEAFVVGYDCAEQLLKLIGHPKLHLFNPLSAIGGQGGGGGGAVAAGAGGANVNNPKNLMGPLNAEMYDAIHLLCMAWNTTPKEPLRRMLEYLNNSPTQPTDDAYVVRFNRILGRDSKGRTLTQMIADLQTLNPTIRAFTFPEINAVLTKKNEASRI
ncbi:conserved hypothetical protein [Burkholderia diffusa]|uniref:hypothetical protein n=1 Tax=Burkholderia diffusa TaxID=488732 RepID=UPI001CAB0265|nr:hypothetical protein [Burkholderia diffusa]CAG9250172.1 conserved hypothetical protein [Burkholderia diffusa]